MPLCAPFAIVGAHVNHLITIFLVIEIGRVFTGPTPVSLGPAGNLLLSKKNWFGQKDSVLHQGEGAVTAVAWAENGLLAWANEWGVKVLDVDTDEKISFVERPAAVPTADCTLLWESDHSLLIGWSQVVQVLEVCSPAASSSSAGE